jgi:hypothetical protein
LILAEPIPTAPMKRRILGQAEPTELSATQLKMQLRRF